MSRDVQLDHVSMRFGNFTAVSDVDLAIKAGEFFSFLGPSGCGKTTILRLISGFMDPSVGMVRIGGQDMRGIGPHKRPTALIFQNLALFPLMKVWENIAFGLEVRGIPKAQRRQRARELLDLVALPDAADKMVAELSGGQKQRVAIARALAVEPQVMLLDEPLSALDLKLRQHMRAELRSIQRRTGVTFIYITHDQGEALTMSDRVAVMSQGRVQQIDQPSRIYDQPATEFVARFVGENNGIAGQVSAIGTDGIAMIDTVEGRLAGRAGPGLQNGTKAVLFIRPEAIEIYSRALKNSSVTDINEMPAKLRHVDFEGSFINLSFVTDKGTEIAVQKPNRSGMGNIAVDSQNFAAFLAVNATILPQTMAATHA